MLVIHAPPRDLPGLGRTPPPAPTWRFWLEQTALLGYAMSRHPRIGFRRRIEQRRSPCRAIALDTRHRPAVPNETERDAGEFGRRNTFTLVHSPTELEQLVVAPRPLSYGTLLLLTGWITFGSLLITIPEHPNRW